MKTAAQTDDRFQSDAGKYAAYLQTPEGRLRLDLAFANLQEFLPTKDGSNALCSLDLGCGTGAIAVRIAQQGFQVTLLDSSQAMLDIAQHAAVAAGVGSQLTLKNGDATTLRDLFAPRSFDVILCHNVLEYVDDPGAVSLASGLDQRAATGELDVVAMGCDREDVDVGRFVGGSDHGDKLRATGARGHSGSLPHVPAPPLARRDRRAPTRSGVPRRGRVATP